jgi:hypothetical protein
MPQPAEADRAAQELIALYERAQADIAAQLEAIATTPGKGNQRRRLRVAANRVDRELVRLDTAARTWHRDRLPDVYGLGGATASVQMGERWAWTSGHQNAVQSLASRSFDDLLSATRYVREETKRWLRDQVRRQAGLSLVEGRTAQQAAKALVSAAGEAVEAIGGPVGYVRYADGSYRTLADYADTALRTTTAQAYNAGSLNQYRALGVTHVLVTDGTACGWDGHDSGDTANGSVRTVAEAMRQPLSHPRCRRSFSAAPQGVTTGDQAARMGLTPTPEQLADQAATELARAASRPIVGRQPRTPRTARSARTARTPRTS